MRLQVILAQNMTQTGGTARDEPQVQQTLWWRRVEPHVALMSLSLLSKTGSSFVTSFISFLCGFHHSFQTLPFIPIWPLEAGKEHQH